MKGKEQETKYKKNLIKLNQMQQSREKGESLFMTQYCMTHLYNQVESRANNRKGKTTATHRIHQRN